MKDLIFQKQWNWCVSGIALSIMFLLAVAFVKPIGVSTQFVIFDGIVWNTFSDTLVVENAESKTGYSSSNAYLNKSGGKYAKNISNPFNYSFLFVLAMILGGFVAHKLQKTEENKDNLTYPVVWHEKFGDSAYKRHIASFIGGMLVLIGARLAGGCTSGHMMSGMMQTSLSGYLFAIGTFAIAVPTAILLYKGVK